MPAASASLRIPNVTSETELLVARCLAEVRSAANLDDVPVLGTVPKRIAPARPKAKKGRSVPPPLPPRALGRSPVASLVMAPVAVPSAAEPLPLPSPSAARAFAEGLAGTPTSTTMKVARASRRASSGFALFLCALVALVTGALAVVRSPLRHHEPVARTVTVATAAAHEMARATLDVLFFGER